MPARVSAAPFVQLLARQSTNSASQHHIPNRDVVWRVFVMHLFWAGSSLLFLQKAAAASPLHIPRIFDGYGNSGSEWKRSLLASLADPACASLCPPLDLLRAQTDLPAS